MDTHNKLCVDQCPNDISEYSFNNYCLTECPKNGKTKDDDLRSCECNDLYSPNANECVCAAKSFGSLCLEECPTHSKTSDTNKPNDCICQNNMKINDKKGVCEINCDAKRHLVATKDGERCECKSGYYSEIENNVMVCYEGTCDGVFILLFIFLCLLF